jgi:TRAP-type C4-dicarboxylate transport system substrate-binding protein
MKGVKLRVMQNPIYIDMFKDFGANAVPLPFSELFTALETGTVDGQENPSTPSSRASSTKCRNTCR